MVVNIRILQKNGIDAATAGSYMATIEKVGTTKMIFDNNYKYKRQLRTAKIPETIKALQKAIDNAGPKRMEQLGIIHKLKIIIVLNKIQEGK